MKTNTKGFTLIELLIVIAIIGILAVAFVPTLLDAPARGRDGQRLANINTIRTVLLDAELRSDLPEDDGCVDENTFADLINQFGGNIPTDPSGASVSFAPDTCNSYYYDVDPSGDGSYKFGLYAAVENIGSANMDCGDGRTQFVDQDALDDDGVELCYAVLVQ